MRYRKSWEANEMDMGTEYINSVDGLTHWISSIIRWAIVRVCVRVCVCLSAHLSELKMPHSCMCYIDINWTIISHNENARFHCLLSKQSSIFRAFTMCASGSIFFMEILLPKYSKSSFRGAIINIPYFCPCQFLVSVIRFGCLIVCCLNFGVFLCSCPLYECKNTQNMRTFPLIFHSGDINCRSIARALNTREQQRIKMYQ